MAVSSGDIFPPLRDFSEVNKIMPNMGMSDSSASWSELTPSTATGLGAVQNYVTFGTRSGTIVKTMMGELIEPLVIFLCVLMVVRTLMLYCRSNKEGLS